MLAVLAAVQLLALGGTVRLPALHVATEADAALACPANAALASAIGLRLPRVRLGRGRVERDDLIASLRPSGEGWRFEVRRSSQAVAMSRDLPAQSDCAQLADTATLILERYLAQIEWRGRPVGIEPLPQPAAKTAPAQRPTAAPQTVGEREGAATPRREQPAPTPRETGAPTRREQAAPAKREQGASTNREQAAPATPEIAAPTSRDPPAAANRDQGVPTNREPVAATNREQTAPVNREQGVPTNREPVAAANRDQGVPTNREQVVTNPEQVAATNREQTAPVNREPAVPTNREQGALANREAPASVPAPAPAPASREQAEASRDPGAPEPTVAAAPTPDSAPAPSRRLLSGFTLAAGGGGWFGIPTDLAGALGLEVALSLLERVRLSLVFAGSTSSSRAIATRGSIGLQFFLGLATLTVCLDGDRLSACGGLAGGAQGVTASISTPTSGQKLYRTNSDALVLPVAGLYGRLALRLFAGAELSADLAALAPLGRGSFLVEGYPTAYTTPPVELIASLRLGWKFF